MYIYMYMCLFMYGWFGQGLLEKTCWLKHDLFGQEILGPILCDEIENEKRRFSFSIYVFDLA